MPLYEYRCHRCDKHFEVRQRFAEAPLKVHDACGGDLERIIFPSALQFKGTGWYVTDYGHGGKSPAANGSNGHGKSESKTESKSESKPESKPESKTGPKPESKSQDQKQNRPVASTSPSEK